VPILEDRPATWADGDQITSGHAFIEFLDLSPDGGRLLVSSNRAGNPDLWVLPSKGGAMRSVTTDPTPDWLPAWSPDGEEIAFYAYRSGNRDIWVMPAEGGPARQITKHPERDSYPAWSPDGQHIAFDSYRAGNEDIWIVSVVDGEVRQLTTQPSSDRIPSWSPDGKWIVFISERGPEGLWRVSVAGGEPEFLTKSGNFPRWSPDGERVYFTGTNEKEGNIWALSPEDGSERPMTDLSARPGRLGAIALATDGRFLYFTWEEDLGDIWVMDVVRND
jgi:Tol biopolymer transport system component